MSRLSPEPIWRLEALRILIPLAVLGFVSSRALHTPEWIGDAGFSVPELPPGDYRQPLYIPPLPVPWAWALTAMLYGSGMALALGFRARTAALVFAIVLATVSLADRLSTFTVMKLGTVLALALACSPVGSAHGLDARRGVAAGVVPPDRVEGAVIWFFRALVITIYFGSGIAKVRGHWLDGTHVIWTHLHDSYQTPLAFWLAQHLPAEAWMLLQHLTLGFELGAPLWFLARATRKAAVLFAVALHIGIALLFAPLGWFSLLMCALCVASFWPQRQTI